MISVWFSCNTCRGSFQKLNDFLEHKKQHHFEEFQRTKCIIFEERRIPNNEHEQTVVSFSPTPQETGETNPCEYIAPLTIKIENENFDAHTNSEFQSHTEDQTLNFFKTDDTISSDQDFQDEADDFLSSKNSTSATHLDLKCKPAVKTSYILENSSVPKNGSSCKNSKTIFDRENKADGAINANAGGYNNSDLDPTQVFMECEQIPVVLLERLSRQENHFPDKDLKNELNNHENNREITFNRKDYVRLPIRNVHSDSGQVDCPQVRCEKSFTENSSLQNLPPTNSSRGLFKCPISSCTQTFKNKRSIRTHMILHSGLRQFKCTQADCELTFQLRHHLTRHLTWSHSNEKPFKCPVPTCDYKCKEKYYLKTHLSKKHKQNKP